MKTNGVFCQREGCGAEIVWGKTENGKPMPVDRRSSADGNVVYRNGVIHVLTNKEKTTIGADVPRYMPHFATCRAGR